MAQSTRRIVPLGRFKRITSALEKARSLDPEDPVVHWAQGVFFRQHDTLHTETERLSLALGEFQKAVETRPNWDEPYRDLGVVLEWSGRLQEAREAYRKFSSLSPMSLTYYQSLSNMSSILKEWDVARKEVDEYLSHRPDDPVGYMEKAYILISGFGDLVGARAMLEAGLRLPPNLHRGQNVNITARHFWLVNYYGGRYQDALDCLEGPTGNWFQRWMFKGQTYMALNQRTSAMACFDSALSIAVQRNAGWSKSIDAAIALRGRRSMRRRQLKLRRRADLPFGGMKRNSLRKICGLTRRIGR